MPSYSSELTQPGRKSRRSSRLVIPSRDRCSGITSSRACRRGAARASCACSSPTRSRSPSVVAGRRRRACGSSRVLHDARAVRGRIPYRRTARAVPPADPLSYGAEALKYDPYFFAPQLSEFDLHLFGEGNHDRIYYKLRRARQRRSTGCTARDSRSGRRMRSASASSGSFNLWDGRKHAMQLRDASGHLGAFRARVWSGTAYKYEIRTRGGSDDPEGRSIRLCDAAAAGQLLDRHAARRLRLGRRPSGCTRAPVDRRAGGRSTSTRCTRRRGVAPTSMTPRS